MGELVGDAAEAIRDRLFSDRALHHIAELFDVDVLCEHFAPLCAVAGRDGRVIDCHRIDAMYRPGASCWVSCEVVGQIGGRTLTAIGVASVSPDGISCRSYLDDPRIPTLRAALDAGMMRSRLRRLGIAGDDQTVESDPVRYKPETSCVIRHRLSGGGRTGEVFGKVYASGAEQHATVLESLALAGDRDPALPLLPRPLAYLGDLGLVVQAPVGKVNLKDLALDEATSAAVAKTSAQAAGAALARVHGLVTTPGVARRLTADTTDLLEMRPLVSALAPSLEAHFDGCIEALGRCAGEIDGEAMVASHGAARIDQFMVGAGGRIGLFDLDGYCWASPARDLANAVAYLEWRAIRCPRESDRIALVEQAWVDGYGAGGGNVSTASLAAFRAASLLKIAARSLRALRFDEWQHLPALVDRSVMWSQFGR